LTETRIERSAVGDWWWSLDRTTLAALSILAFAGIVFLMAGSPAVAARLHYSTFHFVSRQLVFLLPAFAVMMAISLLSLRMIRRLALIIYIVSFILILLAFEYGPMLNGAHRWLMIGGVSIQPSEFIKPAFVVLTAWGFAEGARRTDMPGSFLALILLPLTIVPLVLQPDFGQTMLLAAVWCCLVFTAGLHIVWVLGLGGAGLVGVAVAYEFLPHVQARIDRFLDASSGGNFQVDSALRSFSEGNWFGVGLGEGVVKRYLPDGHTDFIFAVIGEEFGVVVCLALVAVFAFIVLRGLVLARKSGNTFCRLAVTGLVTLFGLQACINMMVNVHLMPAKGMTLPFISYGGSSLLSLAIAMGFLLALTRRRLSLELYGDE
jgi:cell division protein FtsW